MSFSYDAGTTTPGYAGLAEIGGVRINSGADNAGTYKARRIGFLDSPPVRLPVTELPSDHGAYLGPQFYTSWPEKIEGYLWVPTGPDDVPAAEDYLKSALHLTSTEMLTLVMNRRGWATRRQMSVALQGPIQFAPPTPGQWKIPQRDFTIPLIAADPFQYDADTLRSITLPVNGASITLPNNGNTSTPFTLAIPGAGNSASLIDDVTGARITLDSTAIGAGVTVTITTNPAASGGITATDGSGTNWYPHITRMDLLSIIPGSRTFHVTGSGFVGGSTVTVSYRDAWT